MFMLYRRDAKYVVVFFLKAIFILKIVFMGLLFHACRFCYRYSVEDLVGDAKYMVNMKVEVCLEKDKPCILSQDIAKDLNLPKTGCDWSLNFSSKLINNESISVATKCYFYNLLRYTLVIERTL